MEAEESSSLLLLKEEKVDLEEGPTENADDNSSFADPFLEVKAEPEFFDNDDNCGSFTQSETDDSNYDGCDTSEEDIDTDDESETDGESVDESDDVNPDGDSSEEGDWVQVLANEAGPPTVRYTGHCGPIHPPQHDALPIEYLKLFITDSFVQKIVDETNLYASQWIQSHTEYLQRKKRSIVNLWIKQGQTFVNEILAFLGVILNMGLIKKPTLRSYWDCTNSSQATPWFSNHYNRERFELLLKFLHFADNSKIPQPDHPAYKLYKIQPVIDHFQRTFKSHYYPERKISIDESIIGFRGKTPRLRQYMPNKHHARFGIKVWCLCEARSGYTYAFEVYRGTAGMHVSDNGAKYYLVMRLLEKAGLFHRGHHLGLDNDYFSSPKLFEDLWQNGTTATGTVRTNCKGLPMDAVKKKLKNREVSERRKGPLLCVAYKDGKQTPVLLSTSSKGGYKFVKRTGKPDKIVPQIVDDYSHVMGGVDLKDTKLYSCLAERKTLKWTNKAAFSLIGTAVLNSYILYAANTSRSHPLDRYKFMVSLVESLVQNYEPVKNHQEKTYTGTNPGSFTLT
ncbi:piggyBac transposable element-derived protein 4-like [Macrobrachium nipponense]|uniref:piggyBac transposable element-derived protein 4-like n=1 Tax=Macrobrachium nipponense TaxID=159736 RepID=UPI0030C7E25C